MDFRLPDKLIKLQQKLRRFVAKELIPIESQVNQKEDLTRDQLLIFRDKASNLGLWLYDVPKKFGGLGMSLLEQCVVQEEIAKTTDHVKNHRIILLTLGTYRYSYIDNSDMMYFICGR